MTSCLLALPFGHSRPREIGLAGLPSIWVTLPSLTNTFWAQPTAQNGQTESTTLSASTVRGSRCSLRGDIAALPRPSRSAPAAWRSSGQEPMNVLTPTR